jgi:C-methyltransferase
MDQQPHETIWRLATATVASRTLHVVAELGVADHVGDEPSSTKDVAAACGADPAALERALLLLAAHGIFERCGDGFAHTEASRLLRDDHPMSMRAFPRMMGLPSFTASFGRLEHSLRSGSPAFELVEPAGLFEHLQRNPHESAVFDAAMTSKAAADIAAVLDVYDFSRFATIADIGGGRGHLLRAVLEAAPHATGTLFDLPAVIETLDIGADRLALQPGDFFVDALPTADAYVLMEVIHDWDDPQAADILAAVRRSAGPAASVLIIEALADHDHLSPVVHTLDMIMLTITGGRERTVAHLGRLLDSAGFHVAAVHDTPGALRVVEAVVAG